MYYFCCHSPFSYINTSKMFTKTKTLLNVKNNVKVYSSKRAGRMFRCAVLSSSRSESSISEPLISKFTRSINNLATGVHVPGEDVATSEEESKKHTSSGASVDKCSVTSTFSLGNENLNQRRLKLIEIIAGAENLLANHHLRVPHHPMHKSTSQTQSAHLTLKSLFDNQAVVVASYIEKLMGSNHPILNYARSFFSYNSDESSPLISSTLQLRSMIVLLVTKSIGFPLDIRSAPKEIHDGIESKQRALSEITELIYAAQMLHQTVVDIPKHEVHENTKTLKSLSTDINAEISSLHHGNKLATLMGDFLLAKSSNGLASLGNAKVTELMSDSIADFTESEFITKKTMANEGRVISTALNNDGKSKEQKISEKLLNYDKWLQRSKLSIGSLLGHSCYCSTVFSGHEDAVSHVAFHLGLKIGLALQAYKDLTFFLNEDDEHTVQSQKKYFDLWSLPVIFQTEQNASLIPLENIDYGEIFEEVRTSQIAISRTKEVIGILQKDALKLLNQLPGNEISPAPRLLREFLATVS